MGIRSAKPLMAAVTGLPTYIVDQVIRKDLGGGAASILNCRTINGVYVPQCHIIIAIENLLPIAMGVSQFAVELHRRQQMAMIMR